MVNRSLIAFKRNKLAVVGAIMVIIVIVIAAFAHLISPHEPCAMNVSDTFTPPGKTSTYLLGTDSYGRDILSRILHGARVSLTVGAASVVLGALLGTSFGVVAALRRKKLESTIMMGVDVALSVPSLVLGLALMVLFGGGLLNVIIAIGLIFTPRFARVAHGKSLSLSERDYIIAAKAQGAGFIRIVIRHIIPNIMGEILVMASLWSATAIKLEASLSFLGLGVAPPTPTWGTMIRNGIENLSSAPWLAIYPGIAILFAAVGLNTLGDGLRDIIDPKTQSF